MTRDKTTPPTGRIPPQTPAQQGRTLELIPLGQSGDVWRFSGRESDGTVVSFFMVSRTDGTISEVPVPPTDTGPSVGDAN